MILALLLALQGPLSARADTVKTTHDAIRYDPARGFHRETNRAGGLEGGMTDGMPVCVRAYMKPIPTMPESKMAGVLSLKREKMNVPR